MATAAAVWAAEKPTMTHPIRRHLKALVLLVLLWQSLLVAAAAMGCCAGQPACCVLQGTPVVCSACAPLVVPAANRAPTGLASVAQHWPAALPDSLPEGRPAAIWRPPAAATSA